MSAALTLVLRASPLPKLDSIALRLAASGAQILVSTLMAAEPARRVSLMERMSTRSAVVPAALEMATLYETCVAELNSPLVYGSVTVRMR